MNRTTLAAALVTALTALAILAPSAGAHRPGLHRAGELDAPLLHWRGYLIRDTNRIRAAKCLRTIEPYFTRAELPVSQRHRAVVLWLDRRASSRRAAPRCLLARAWSWYRTGSTQCVVNGEGGWTSVNPTGKYRGRFQADADFARAYGPAYALARWGTLVNLWTPDAQVVMGFRGYSARGWSPWPNTARACGLL